MLSIKIHIRNKNESTKKLQGLRRNMLGFVMGFILLISFLSCIKQESNNTLFIKIEPEKSGVTFQNTLHPTNALNILDYLYYYNGAGVAVGDINNDNLPDVYFTSNQGNNKLYLNKGNFTFEDITEKTGVVGKSDWNTGTVMADVNGDGFLDIYVCAVVGIHGFEGANELFINNGDNTFTEQAEQYGLAFKNYSTSAAFFDYDNDGDLDMYLLNHAVHTQNSFGKAEIRNNRDEKSGDKLLRNDDNVFTDVSAEAGIFGGANGYGLGIAVQDFNQDGFTDIYVSNDFHEDDYYYLNNGDGTFTEQLKKYFGKTSRFSMGNDVADINHDGLPDILTLDMAPEDEVVLKASMGDESTDILNMRTQNMGYHYQYARNMLQINDGSNFCETALLSGISSTDWSWSALFSDYNQDGEQDVFITNGIPKRPNNLDYIKYLSNNQIREQLDKTNLIDNEALKMMPSGNVANVMYQGTGNIKYKNQTVSWIGDEAVISNGAAYADFDNDGDIDLVTNNINTPVTFYKNTIDTTTNYLKLKFKYKRGNVFGLGTKVISYHNGIMQYCQLFNSKGFQSSSEAILHFGYGDTEIIDSLKVIWPDNTIQTAEYIKTNQTLTIIPLNKRFHVNYDILFPKKSPWLTKIDSIKGLDFTHIENSYIDANKHKLIPYQISDRGPATVVGDFNNDGKDDVFFGASKGKSSQLFIQTEIGFVKSNVDIFNQDKQSEFVAACILDANNDGRNDLFVAAGGGEYYGNSKPLLDKLYINKNGNRFLATALPEYFENAAVVKSFDVDNDGDIDLFIGNHANAKDFGKLPVSYILINENGNFKTRSLGQLGMLTDAVITDFNTDGQKDIIVVGEWMEPILLQNNNGDFKNVTANYLQENYSGLWQSIAVFDIDNDGDDDYVLGNFGLNTKFRASQEFPMRMYVADFDNNKTTETITAIEKNGKYFTLQGLDELAGQLNYLKKKYNTYKDFSGKTITEIFGKEKLDNAVELTVTTLSSGYLRNDKSSFSFVPFDDFLLQLSPLRAMLKYDFNKDGHEELLLGGNYFGVTPYHGKFDSFSGAAITKNGTIIPAHQIGVNFFGKAVKNLNILKFETKKYLLVTYNNHVIEIYKIED